MKAIINKSQLKGEVEIISSKSYAHRILICSAFSTSQTKIYNLPNSQDISATISCLKSLGANFEFVDNYCLVTPTIIKEYDAELFVGESGSTLRFLLPIVSALGGNYKLIGTKKLMSRPSLTLLNCLKENGVTYKIGLDYIKIIGKLSSANFDIDSSLSSQFLTGIMLASPLMSFANNITLKGLSSSDYIEITKDVISKFGIQVVDKNNGYQLLGKYTSPKEIVVEGDYSNALFFAIGGILCGEVLIKGLNPYSKQGDKKAFDILMQAGANISFVDNGILFKKSTLKSVNFNGDIIPDAIPALSLLFANAQGETIIQKVRRLKFKECDRVEAILNYFNIAGGIIEYKNDNLIIKNSTLKGGKFSSFNDHRMVMTIAILGCLIGGVEIEDIQAVNKSYPQFFEVLKSIGGQFCIS